MIYTLDLSEFGKQIRRVREVLGFTRANIFTETGISTETLRKIEKGESIPQITTLHILSKSYNIDVLNIFNQYKSDNIIMSIHQKIDKLLVQYPYHTKTLDEYLISEKDLNTCRYVDHKEIILFNSLIRNLPLSNNSDANSKKAALLNLNSSLMEYNPKITEENFEEHTLSYMEMRVLFVCGVIYAELGDTKTSNRILYYIKQLLENIKMNDILVQQLYIKLLCNIAYNSHSLDKHRTALSIVDKAVSYLNEINSSYLLENLLYRKGIAEYLLGISTFNDTLFKSRTILEIKRMDMQLEDYERVSMANYNIRF